MIGIDMKAWFVPSFRDSDKMTPAERKAATVMGTIVYSTMPTRLSWLSLKTAAKLLKKPLSSVIAERR